MPKAYETKINPICAVINITRLMRIFVPSLLLVSFCLQASPDRVTGKTIATRSEVIAKNGMVATSQPLATQIGLDILKQGGSAVDAAIAANAALGLMEPTGSGIGGDLFAIVWDAKSKKLYGLNASGRSPKGLSLKKLKSEISSMHRTTIPPYGMLPISVPGAVDGWFELHNKFGKLPMKQILKPAIKYGKEGFPVSELISFYWQRSVPRLSPQKGSFSSTFTINGKGPSKGQIFKNPELASSLSAIEIMVTCDTKILQSTLLLGSSHYQQTIEALMFSSYRPMGKELRHYKYSIFWKITILKS